MPQQEENKAPAQPAVSSFNSCFSNDFPANSNIHKLLKAIYLSSKHSLPSHACRGEKNTKMTAHGAGTAWRVFLSGKARSFFGEGTESVEVCLWCGDTATQKVRIRMVFLYKLILKLR